MTINIKYHDLSVPRPDMPTQDVESDDEFDDTVLENENEEEENNEEATAKNDSDIFEDCME